MTEDEIEQLAHDAFGRQARRALPVMLAYASTIDEKARGQRLGEAELYRVARQQLADDDRVEAQHAQAVAREQARHGPKLPPPEGWHGGGGN